MRRFFILVAAALSLVSCSVVQKTSKSLSLTPQAVQLPTFYELDVAENVVSKDTAWHRNWLSTDRSSVEDIKSVLTASILSANRADVLVEPKVSLKSVGYPWKKQYYLTVAGYPAKYKNFHTATPAEYDMLYGKRVDEYFGKSDLSLVLPSAGSVEKNHVNKSVTTNFLSSSNNERPMEARTYIDVFYIPDNLPLLGIGRGHFVNQNLFSGYEAFVGSIDYGYRKSPVFGAVKDYRYYIGQGKLSPFVGAAAGLAFMDGDIGIPLQMTAGLSLSKIDLGLSVNYIIQYEQAYPSLTFRYRF